MTWRLAPAHRRGGVVRRDRERIQFIPSVRQALLRNPLGYTLLIAIVITVVSGILISQVDPAISSIRDGIWFAWVTLTTVGYGDLVPKSNAGASSVGS